MGSPFEWFILAAFFSAVLSLVVFVPAAIASWYIKRLDNIEGQLAPNLIPAGITGFFVAKFVTNPELGIFPIQAGIISGWLVVWWLYAIFLKFLWRRMRTA